MGLVLLPTLFPDIFTSMRLFALQSFKGVHALSTHSSTYGFVKGTQVPGLCAGNSNEFCIKRRNVKN